MALDFLDNNPLYNQGTYPLVNFHFMLRCELLFDLPCKSVKVFSKENEFELIQEGGVNDFVHMRRKPISKPFTMEVERYVGVDWLDPMPLGADLILPLILMVGRQYGTGWIPFLCARTYIFTGCTVIKKTYGELDGYEGAKLLVETTTIAYRELINVDIPWSGADAVDNIGASSNNTSGRSKEREILELQTKALGIIREAAKIPPAADACLALVEDLTRFEEYYAEDEALKTSDEAAKAAVTEDAEAAKTSAQAATEAAQSVLSTSANGADQKKYAEAAEYIAAATQALNEAQRKLGTAKSGAALFATRDAEMAAEQNEELVAALEKIKADVETIKAAFDEEKAYVEALDLTTYKEFYYDTEQAVQAQDETDIQTLKDQEDILTENADNAVRLADHGLEQEKPDGMKADLDNAKAAYDKANTAWMTASGVAQVFHNRDEELVRLQEEEERKKEQEALEGTTPDGGEGEAGEGEAGEGEAGEGGGEAGGGEADA